MGVNDDAWRKFFDQRGVLEKVAVNGFCALTAADLKAVTGLEPRILAKIDSKEKQPEPFQKAGLYLLATSNGSYRIGRGDPFITVPARPDLKVEKVTFPVGYVTLPPDALSSESLVMDVASITGILDEVFGEKAHLTVRGRKVSGPINVKHAGIEFAASGVQVEVDGGYEGTNGLYLIEAKSGIWNSLSIRQLLYPHLDWAVRSAGRKPVHTMALLYEEPFLRFLPFRYDGNKMVAVTAAERHFILVQPSASPTVVEFTKPVTTPPPATAPVQKPAGPAATATIQKSETPSSNAPFPQADDFETVLSIFADLYRAKSCDLSDLFVDLPLVERQWSYYGSVLVWFGLATRASGRISITKLGNEIAQLYPTEKVARLAAIAMTDPIFQEVAIRPTATAESIPDKYFMRWGITGNTRKRRLSTVRAWISYFEKVRRALR